MKDKEWCIIANPMAGGGKVAKKWSKIEAAFQAAGLRYVLFFTEKKGHASGIAAEQIKNGFRFILGIGGDGTNSEITDGILRQKTCASTEIIYTLLPYGRGNDWARGYGITNSLADFFDRLQRGKTRYQDAGSVFFQGKKKEQQRYFVNVAGMAYDGYLVKTSEENPGGIKGQLHYQLMILRCLASYQAPRGQVHFNGQTVEDAFYLINVGLCKYSGGGMQLVPHAVPDNGRFALTIAGNVPKWDVILQTPRFYNGNIGNYRLVQLHESPSIEVEHTGDLAIHVEVDGEYLGTSPARFSILEKALQILV